MKVHKGFSNIEITNAVVTTGSFDGVHVGHKVIINRLIQRAGELGGESVLITFYPHPRKVLYPDSEGKNLRMINSQEEKIKLLEKLGLDHLIIVNFTIEFSRTTSIEFIKEYLIKRLSVKHVIIGFNHHFGFKREGDLEKLWELGRSFNFSVEEIPVQDIQNESVSSTKIRKALSQGNIQRANAYLDHPYVLSGKIESYCDIADFSVIRLSFEEIDKLLPPPGGYAISIQGEDARYKAALWIVRDLDQTLKYLFVFEESSFFNDQQEVCFHFHKRISNIEIIDDLNSESLLREMTMVRDLIY